MPRDINRIPPAVARLMVHWLNHPDLRLGQLILNLTAEEVLTQLYNLEDEELLKRMDETYGKKVAIQNEGDN